MSGYILGKKIKMEQMFNSQGERLAVTYIDTNDCYLLGVKTKETDNYDSIILGYGLKKNIKKPIAGKLKKIGINLSIAWIKEVRIKNNTDNIRFNKKNNTVNIGDKEYKIGSAIKSQEIFQINDPVSITGISKGKGFAGVVKRHHFAGGPRTHGQSDRERAPGSIGQTTTPGRVYKGKRMAGRLGGQTVTVKNLPIVNIADNYLIVKGAVPGPSGNYLIIKTQDKR